MSDGQHYDRNYSKQPCLIANLLFFRELASLLFALTATFFLFNSKKKEGKEMPPRKIAPQAVLCAPRSWWEQNKLATIKLSLKQILFRPTKSSGARHDLMGRAKIKSEIKTINLNVPKSGFEVAFDLGALSTV